MACKIIFVLQVSLECFAGNGMTGHGVDGNGQPVLAVPQTLWTAALSIPSCPGGVFYLVVYNHRMWQLMTQSL